MGLSLISKYSTKGCCPQLPLSQFGFRLYLSEVWSKNKKRRAKTGMPEEVEFQSKPL